MLLLHFVKAIATRPGRAIVVLLLGLLQLSCSYLAGDDGIFRDRQGEYLRAPVEPEIRVPDNLDSFTLDQLYVVPDEVISVSEDLTGSVPRPKPLDSNRPEGVMIRRFSGENWIVIAAAPGQVWPRVRDYWTQRGIELDYENPVDGVMETVWRFSPGIIDEREKLRLRIEPGIHNGSSEISLVQISRPESATANELIVWPRLSDSEEREFEVLQEISQYLADRTDIYSSSSASLLAGSLSGESKASLIESPGQSPVLEVRISLNRAWGQVGQALGDAGIDVLSRDRDNNVFEVDFAGQDGEVEGGGFFSRVFSDDEEEQQSSTNRFQLRLEEISNGVRITARPVDGNSPAAVEAELLQSILTNL